MNRNLRRLFLIGAAVGMTCGAAAQRGPVQVLSLQDFSPFRTPPENWVLLKDITVHPDIDPSSPAATAPAPEAEPDTRKRRRRKRRKQKQAPPPPPPPAIREQAGSGVLFNRNDREANGHLVTNWEHGDMVLELEVLLPKGSNSGLYFQGRYELQLRDSWGKDRPTFADMGGIYRNWDYPPDQTYPGKPPLQNAAKAPGLWQHLVVAFRAPRFNAAGEKVENARFVAVDLNGVRIHENVAVPTPTRGALSREETDRGPLLIQGDHGPVAFRNMRYQLLEELPVSLSGLTYELYPGRYASPEAVIADTAAARGDGAKLSFTPAEGYGPFGMVWRGKLEAPAAGRYDFQLSCYGGARLQMGGQSFTFPHQYFQEDTLQVELAAGSHPFELIYFRRDAYIPKRFGLFNITAHPAPLHAEAMFAPPAAAPPIYVAVGGRPRLLRAFYDYEGDRDRRLTHTIGVGSPQGLHYLYDLKAGNLIGVWRGAFIDATPMWRDRGDGSFRPLGPVQHLFTGHSFAFLPDSTAAFPKQLGEADGFRNKGYELDPASGYPVFLFEIGGAEVRDRIAPDAAGKGLVRQLQIKGAPAEQPFVVKLAEGKDIRKLEAGWYAVDQAYFLKLPEDRSAEIRARGDRRELVFTLTSTLEYTINW